MMMVMTLEILVCHPDPVILINDHYYQINHDNILPGWHLESALKYFLLQTSQQISLALSQ